jgi:hypothetical protein
VILKKSLYSLLSRAQSALDLEVQRSTRRTRFVEFGRGKCVSLRTFGWRSPIMRFAQPLVTFFPFRAFVYRRSMTGRTEPSLSHPVSERAFARGDHAEDGFDVIHGTAPRASADVLKRGPDSCVVWKRWIRRQIGSQISFLQND